MSSHLLTLVTFTPLVGLIVLLFVNGRDLRRVRTAGLLFSCLPLVWALWILVKFQVGQAEFQLVEDAAWLSLGESLQLRYHLGVDGISVPMVLLTAILSAVAGVASLSISERAKEYWIYYLLLQVGMYGTFVALDLFLFYIFWELVLIPMYFLIGIWGGPRREYAAIKFFLYTFGGSVLMLIGFLTLYFQFKTFQFDELAALAPGLTRGLQIFIFFSLFIGFAIKVPVWPFHTWLPDAHVEAPTPISVILAGVLLKMGTYGFFRFSFPLCPDVAQMSWILAFMAVLGVIGIVYGAFLAFAQRDFKKLVAYSSVSHMGFVLLGLSGMTIMGLSGAYFQSFSHGILSGAMFLLVGVVYDRAHTRDMDAFGGLLVRVPVYGGILFYFALGSLGLPGLSGFIAEFFVLLGSWSAYPWLVVITGVGIVMTAAYTLMMIRRVLLGPLNEKWKELPEINGREIGTLVPLALVTLALGLCPKLLTDISNPSLQSVLDDVAPVAAETGLPNHETILASYGIDPHEAEAALHESEELSADEAHH